MTGLSVPPPSRGPLDVLVLATHAAEFGSLARHLGPSLSGEIGPVRLACKTVGVGAAVAAAATAKRLVQLDPKAVLLLGTAALYPGRSGWREGDVAVVNAAHAFSLAASQGLASFPGPMRRRAEVDGPLSRCLHELGGQRVGAAAVASPVARTTDRDLGQRIAAETGADLEHLEAFAVLAACNWLQVPVAALLGVLAFPEGNATSREAERVRAAATAASEQAVAWLHRGAPGVPHSA